MEDHPTRRKDFTHILCIVFQHLIEEIFQDVLHVYIVLYLDNILSTLPAFINEVSTHADGPIVPVEKWAMEYRCPFE